MTAPISESRMCRARALEEARWSYRAMGVRLARVLGCSEASIQWAKELYADPKYRTRPPRFWVDAIRGREREL